MKKNSKRRLIKKIDKLFSEIVRSVGRCERCGKTTGLQNAHIYSRVHQSLRWDKLNCLCLCYACHIFWGHRNPMEFYRFVETKRTKQEMNYLETKATEITHNKYEDLEKIYVDLKAETKKSLDI